MYCFLFFVLLLGVEGQLNSTSENSTTEYNSGTSLTTSKTEESTSPIKYTLGSKPTSGTQKPLSTPEDTKCSLCVQDILKPLPLIVIGALAITCFTMLVMTLVLACNMCCLKRQISSSYQVCSDTTQSTTRRVSVDCEKSETLLMMNEIGNGMPEGDEIQAEPKEPEKPEEAAKEVPAAEVTNPASTEGFAQDKMPAAESPPNQDFPPPMEDAAISE